MLIHPFSVAAMAALGALSPQLMCEAEFYLPEAYELKGVVGGVYKQWGSPLLLPAMLSTPPHSRWRGRVATTPLENPSPLYQQLLPLIAFVEAAEDSGEVEGLAEKEVSYEHPHTVYRDEYRPSEFAIDSIRLLFKLDREATKVMTRLVIRRLPLTSPQHLVLNGEDLVLEEVLLDGKVLEEDPHIGYSFWDYDKLIIPDNLLPKEADVPFVLIMNVTINPLRNIWRKGLFMAQNSFVTQCEPGGFRRITYFLDRPDILTHYHVRLEADEKEYPVLLSNGNRVGGGRMGCSPGRHFATFEDPYPKGSHFFGIVAGNFGVLKDSFVTASGRQVTLQLFSKPEDVDKLDWARQCLQKSMRWDEENFGREYDLDILNVVCVDNFGGQMANKGLLIFDCDTLLADPKTSTDAELFNVMSAVGHEYFRNWTGIRVSIRDWFQLIVNAGLTKFRESLFTAAMYSPADRRVRGIRYMFTKIFRLDDGPRAQLLRPDSYDDIYDLYNPAVHWKASEVVRAYQNLLGVDVFRKGMDLYFERHSDKTVTVEDFRKAMEDASNLKLRQFDLWYSQAGTPEVRVDEAKYLPDFKAYSITLTQFVPPTKNQPTKLPLMIPIKIGLIGKENKKDVLDPPTTTINLTSEKQTFFFYNVQQDCVPSLHREFGAPVKFYDRLAAEQRAFILAHDSDPVNKWRSANVFFTSFILSRAVIASQNSSDPFIPLPVYFIQALRVVLLDKNLDYSVKAVCLLVPKTRQLSEKLKPTDYDALHRARRSVINDVYDGLHKEMVELFERLIASRADCHTHEGIGRRSLRNELLVYLSEPRDREAAQRAFKYFSEAECVTDKYFALSVLSNMNQPERELALNRFYKDANGDKRLINGWFSVQASSDISDQVERIYKLQEHPAFSFEKPNSVRFLLFDFVLTNEVHFHRKDGKGYKLLADAVVKLDEAGSPLAATAAKLFLGWHNLKKDRQDMMNHHLKHILQVPTLSKNIRKIISEALGSEKGSRRK